MNVLFLTLVEIDSVEDRGIYQDLLRKFRNEGHDVTIVTPVERRKGISTNYKVKDGVSILQVKTLNIQKAHIIEKGIGTLAIEYQYLLAIKKYASDKKFDLVLYSTPPITFAKVISYIKKRDHAYSYLLLKDIFPQNAVDIGMLKEKGFLHRQFLNKEKKLYQISDTIGCMSPANAEFILRHNPEINSQKVEVNPNTIEPIEINYTDEEKRSIRQQYQIPIDKRVLVYGGNLGKPQGVDFLLETIAGTKNENAFFLIVGNGTEFPKIKQWFETNNPPNAKLLQSLPKEDYDKLLASSDIGLIFLDKNFLIPNFPSRLLSYLEMQKPVITATDPNTDIGDIVEKNGCGLKVLAGDIQAMNKAVDTLVSEDLKTFQENCISLLHNEYLVDKSYQLIIKRIL
ncbi:glycosyltransferase WbuB [Chryseobacterium nematophagum]|uniref:Glycosyltransferase WbuB n=1 Tax=Chryseobacterium nematophagum TaxID=2305228 RepID=A0A3M7TEE8_9FLAO|nr:glycosyltransferase family 4 protein [Chryseobacterium nematophagum]RNA61678.1 glycosyltransferase WbuB [Chryseobacterium nematophagum]